MDGDRRGVRMGGSSGRSDTWWAMNTPVQSRKEQTCVCACACMILSESYSHTHVCILHLHACL
jgi:hypothetical protein